MAGGGIGEAMLIGAAIGGGSTAIFGGNRDEILKAALVGGATGGAGAGLSTGISALASGTPISNILSGAAAETAAAGAGSGGISALNPTASQVAANLGVPGTEVGLGANSQSAMLADQLKGFGTEGLNSLSMATEGGVPPGMDNAMGPVGTQRVSLFDDPLGYLKDNKMLTYASGMAGAMAGQPKYEMPKEEESELNRRYRWGSPLSNYRWGYADGGIASLNPGYDIRVGEQPMYPQPYAQGGVSDLGHYSDGGRMLKGPGDGMSDSIPGVIANKRPARLADGEFVVPADVVSHLGNGSTDAGAKQLYAMMDKVRKARTGTKKQGREINPRRFMPA